MCTWVFTGSMKSSENFLFHVTVTVLIVDLCVLRAINSQRSPDCVSHHLKLGIVFTQDGCAVAVQGKIPGRAALVIGGAERTTKRCLKTGED